MNSDSDKTREYYEILVQNARKGEMYAMRLKDNPIVYEGIPIIQRNFDDGRGTMFTMRVVKPEREKGIYKNSIYNIDMLERVEG